jgi:hypothetical protein
MMRSDNIVTLQQPDLAATSCDSSLEGKYQSCHIIVLILDHGKTNSAGKIEYGGSYRAKNVKSCFHGALALHFSSRWHVICCLIAFSLIMRNSQTFLKMKIGLTTI